MSLIPDTNCVPDVQQHTANLSSNSAGFVLVDHGNRGDVTYLFLCGCFLYSAQNLVQLATRIVFPTHNDRHNLLCVADFLQRIAVEQHHVRLAALLDHSIVVALDSFAGSQCFRTDAGTYLSSSGGSGSPRCASALSQTRVGTCQVLLSVNSTNK